MNDRILSLLGLCRRAGKMTLGNDVVIDNIIGGKSKLVIMADDISKNTSKSILSAAHRHNVKVLTINRSKDELGMAVGKYCAVLSIDDSGFAKKLKELIANETEQEE